MAVRHQGILPAIGSDICGPAADGRPAWLFGGRKANHARARRRRRGMKPTVSSTAPLLPPKHRPSGRQARAPPQRDTNFPLSDVLLERHPGRQVSGVATSLRWNPPRVVPPPQPQSRLFDDPIQEDLDRINGVVAEFHRDGDLAVSLDLHLVRMISRVLPDGCVPLLQSRELFIGRCRSPPPAAPIAPDPPLAPTTRRPETTVTGDCQSGAGPTGLFLQFQCSGCPADGMDSGRHSPGGRPTRTGRAKTEGVARPAPEPGIDHRRPQCPAGPSSPGKSLLSPLLSLSLLHLAGVIQDVKVLGLPGPGGPIVS